MTKFSVSMSACALICATAAIYLWVENRNLEFKFDLERKRFQNQAQQQTTRYQEAIAAFNAYLEHPVKRQSQQASPENSASRITSGSAIAARSPLAHSAAQPLLEAEEISWRHAVNEKYRVLFSEISLDASTDKQLQSLLLERERLAALPTVNYFSAPESLTEHVELRAQALDELDQRIVDLLDANGSRLFELTRNSEFEQHQLKAVTDSLSAVNPLSHEQERTLLLAKLRHKEAFNIAMRDYATAQSNKRAMADEAVKALARYRDDYLQEASAYLDEEQMAALTDFEALSFEEMEDSLLASLQTQ
ncbi:hypothetical protein EUZ85_05960 [Hahella sp. KA22]|uniref:hypothetical protein n=1 Tax=Hahella sp. KA22 TaxID=1628392 RepID=UPI000FDE1260|nr:hypothetical protein [Hahella sp. KA22]AZZ90286.1 hypothetical protein ENC22_03410 [Hahella sp. KA22]QAY53656.1 hypothetical protein EUZ85_05960 [Hahella sp. KA22]